jgi:hypothetical protein
MFYINAWFNIIILTFLIYKKKLAGIEIVSAATVAAMWKKYYTCSTAKTTSIVVIYGHQTERENEAILDQGQSGQG